MTGSQLHDRIVLITGATSGIGEACARQMHERGARLILTGRRADRLKTLQADMGSDRVLTLCFDVRDSAACQKAVENLPADWRDIYGLINNAGLALGTTPADQSSLDHWNTMIDTNCRGLVTMTRFILPGMRARSAGHIVNIGSVAGTYPYAGGNVYGATKAFVMQFSHNLRCDLLGTPVRVTNIEPGLCETEFSVVRFDGDKARADKVYENVTPLNANDIASSVVWALEQPAHVNINRIELMPVAQAAGGVSVHRGNLA